MTGLPELMPRLRSSLPQLGRLDRLGWRVGTCFQTHGLRLGVRSNDDSLLERLAPHLPPGWQPASSPFVDQIFSLWVGAGRTGRPGSRVYTGRARRVCAPDLTRALGALESEIRLGVAASARDRIFVHAGVVGWRGAAIVLPGRSRSGKTTLVAELLRAGASYLSDEFAPLDRRGRVHPFAKPLSIRGEGGCDVHLRRLPAGELGSRDGRRPLRVGLVAFAEFRPGARWAAAPLSRGQAVVELLAHTVPARLRPEASLEALERAVATALVLKGERGEAAETARLLLSALEDREPPASPQTR